MLQELCFIDVETTGLTMGYHEIIDVAVVRTNSLATRVLSEWSQRIQPLRPLTIDPGAQKVNGFTQEEWALEPRPSRDIWKSFSEQVDGAIPIGHNPSFDRGFLELEADKFDIKFPFKGYHWVGTESIAWVLFVRGQIPSLSLRVLGEHFGVEPEDEIHTALGWRSILSEGLPETH